MCTLAPRLRTGDGRPGDARRSHTVTGLRGDEARRDAAELCRQRTADGRVEDATGTHALRHGGAWAVLAHPGAVLWVAADVRDAGREEPGRAGAARARPRPDHLSRSPASSEPSRLRHPRQYRGAQPLAVDSQPAVPAA